jgi:hypothetical protein
MSEHARKLQPSARMHGGREASGMVNFAPKTMPYILLLLLIALSQMSRQSAAFSFDHRWLNGAPK